MDCFSRDLVPLKLPHIHETWVESVAGPIRSVLNAHQNPLAAAPPRIEIRCYPLGLACFGSGLVSVFRFTSSQKKNVVPEPLTHLGMIEMAVL